MRADEIPDQIDARIDAALRSYSQPPAMPEPRMVLARILERARSTQPPSRNWWPWMIPAAGCAVALLVAATWVLRVPRIPEIAWTPQPPRAVSVAAAPAAGSAPMRGAHSVPKPEVRAAAENLPKLETFPAPAPLAPEEQNLAAFTRQVPPAIVHQVIEAKQHIDDPIDIAELKIQPLDEGDQPAPPKGKDQ